MIKIYDCSNSNGCLHRRDFGPKDNDIISSLKEYAYLFDCKFVNRYTLADIIITNDIFPEEIRKIDIPKIKRMDGIFWKNNSKYRNDQLNDSAEIADHVIFISQYSKNSLDILYPNIKLKSHSIILNGADNKIFTPKKNFNNVSNFKFTSICSNWSRDEKRLNKLIEFSNNISDTINIIGTCDIDTPPNIIKLGYIDDYYKINKILNESDAFINLSYKDAAPKVVCQAVACGLPILYADSGGVSEIVDYGISIKDNKNICFEDDVFDLDINEIMSSYNELKINYKTLIGKVKRNYLATIKNYYEIIEKYGNRKKILDKRT